MISNSIKKNPEIDLQQDIKANMEMILRENTQLAAHLDYNQAARIIPSIQNAERIFITGAGRTGLALKSTAMRLMHLGFNVFVVGEIITPAIRKGDLLIAGSGSGTTGSIVTAAEKAVKAGARVVAFSTTTESPLAKFCDHIVILPAAQKQDHGSSLSKQYAGSLFEQAVLLMADAIIQTLWRLDGTPAEELWKSHANLE